MENNGYIKLYRKMLENPIICKDSDYLSVWVYLLLNATHSEYDVIFKNERRTLLPGQLITGRKTIGEKFGIDENKVQRILKNLEKQHQIEQQTSTKNRLITIVNWNKYQNERHQNEQQVNNKRTTSEQQVNTNKNDKNDKNEEEINNNINEMSSNINDDIAKIDKLMIECLNTTNINNIMECTEYLEKMPIEVIEYALKKTARISQPNWKYAMSILDSYVQKNIDTLEKAKADDLSFKSKNLVTAETKKEETLEEQVARYKKEWGLTDED